MKKYCIFIFLCFFTNLIEAYSWEKAKGVARKSGMVLSNIMLSPIGAVGMGVGTGLVVFQGQVGICSRILDPILPSAFEACLKHEGLLGGLVFRLGISACLLAGRAIMLNLTGSRLLAIGASMNPKYASNTIPWSGLFNSNFQDPLCLKMRKRQIYFIVSGLVIGPLLAIYLDHKSRR
jgi:hypothetical protein